MTEKQNLYRVQVSTQKIVGPCDLKQIKKMVVAELITEEMLYQRYPAGKWLSGKLYKEIADLFHGKSETKIKESLLEGLGLQEDKKNPESSFQEFNSSQYDLSEEIEIEAAPPKPEPLPEEIEATQEETEGEEKTVINPKWQSVPFQEVKEPSQEMKFALEVKQEEAPSLAEEEKSDKTELINLKEFALEIKQQAPRIEIEIEAEAAKKIEEKKVVKETKKEVAPPKKQRISQKTIIIVVLIAAVLYLFNDDKVVQKAKVPQYVQISFPVSHEYEEVEKAKELYDKAVFFLNSEDYVSRIKAMELLKNSLEFQFNNNPALGPFLSVSSELASQSKDKRKSAQTLFRLTQIVRGKVLSNPEIALGVATYFEEYGKEKAALQTLESYLRSSAPTPAMFASLLRLYAKNSALDKAEQAFQKLAPLPNKSTKVYYAMAQYLLIKDEKEQGNTLIIEALKKYPKSNKLLLLYCEYLFRAQKFAEMKKVLEILDQNDVVVSPKEYGKFLEYLAIWHASKKDIKKAGEVFSQAIKYSEGSELRQRLAMLEVGGDQISQNLILESKAYVLMKKAREAMEEKNWQMAFKQAIDAVDIKPEMVDSNLLLAEIQIKRGFYNEALNSLLRISKNNPNNFKITFALIDANIEAFKYNDAKTQISIISTGDLAQTYEYAFYLGKYYERTDNLALATKWYQEAISRNPLSDESYFKMAMLFFRYKNLKKTQVMLGKAVELDPSNMEYRSLYAQILYETSTADAAIGYLRDLLSEVPDDPQIIGDIAIFYYKTGQVKEFNLYKQRLENLPTKSEPFYQFMLRAAKLEDKNDDVIFYSKKLIELNPGDLEAQLTLALYYLNNKNYPDARILLNEINRRLPSYPKLHYYLAKIAIAENKLDEALKESNAEIEANTSSESGYIALGKVQLAKNNILEAIKAFEKAVSLNGKSVEALMELALVKQKQNYNETARELFVKVLKEDPTYPEAHRQIGLVYRDIGQGALAAESLKTYLELAPQATDKPLMEQIIRQLQ